MIETTKIVKVTIQGDDVDRFVEICEIAQQHMDETTVATSHDQDELREFIKRIIDAEL